MFSPLVSRSRFLFELARRGPGIPDAVLAKLYDASEKLRAGCCSTKDPSACLDSKVGAVGALGTHPAPPHGTKSPPRLFPAC